MEIDRVPEAPPVVPEVGETASQAPPEVVEGVAEKFRAAPLLEIVMGWLAGVDPPVWYANVSVGVEVPRLGAGFTMKVTPMDCGLFAACEEVRLMLPV